jgi:hypothetical protein
VTESPNLESENLARIEAQLQKLERCLDTVVDERLSKTQWDWYFGNFLHFIGIQDPESLLNPIPSTLANRLSVKNALVDRLREVRDEIESFLDSAYATELWREVSGYINTYDSLAASLELSEVSEIFISLRSHYKYISSTEIVSIKARLSQLADEQTMRSKQQFLLRAINCMEKLNEAIDQRKKYTDKIFDLFYSKSVPKIDESPDPEADPDTTLVESLRQPHPLSLKVALEILNLIQSELPEKYSLFTSSIDKNLGDWLKQYSNYFLYFLLPPIHDDDPRKIDPVAREEWIKYSLPEREAARDAINYLLKEFYAPKMLPLILKLTELSQQPEMTAMALTKAALKARVDLARIPEDLKEYCITGFVPHLMNHFDTEKLQLTKVSSTSLFSTWRPQDFIPANIWMLRPVDLDALLTELVEVLLGEGTGNSLKRIWQAARQISEPALRLMAYGVRTESEFINEYEQLQYLDLHRSITDRVYDESLLAPHAEDLYDLLTIGEGNHAIYLHQHQKNQYFTLQFLRELCNIYSLSVSSATKELISLISNLELLTAAQLDRLRSAMRSHLNLTQTVLRLIATPDFRYLPNARDHLLGSGGKLTEWGNNLEETIPEIDKLIASKAK